MRVIALSALLTTGCALMTASAPQAGYKPSQTPKCSSNRLGVGVDVVLALLWGAGAVAAADSESGAALGLALVGVAHAGSAIGGNQMASQCDKAIARHEDWVAKANRAAPPPPRPRPKPRPAATAKTDGSRGRTTEAPARRTRRRVPVPGNDEWAEFWREVSP